ncbi:MAG: MBL fold metallo-hydrolase [Bacillota bacterium]
MDLIHLNKSCYYLKGAVNIGIISIEGKVILIDTGIDKQTAKNIEKAVKAENWTITHIINTHAHADHFSGAQYLKEVFQARVMAPKIEGIIMEHPVYEPFYLFGGAHPINELKNKFLQGSPVIIDSFIEPGPINIYDRNIEIVALPGHTMGQVGVCFENIIYLADAAFSLEVLKKHGIPYFVDIDQQLKTLDYLETFACTHYLPAHGEAVNNIKDLTINNRQYLYGIANTMRELFPGTTEEIIARLLNSYKITVTNPGQYFLLKAASLAFISFLNNSGEITWEIESNILKWKKNTQPDALVKQ